VDKFDIDNVNDRILLILLRCKEHKSRADIKVIKQLENIYPNNKIYEDKLCAELMQLRYITRMPKDSDRGILLGRDVYRHITTKSGEDATKKDSIFQSESKWAKRNEKKYCQQKIRDIISIIGGIVGLIGGMLGIILFFK